ncbi:MAG: hypothetical protein ACPLRW_08770 [Moorellales bacterium]
MLRPRKISLRREAGFALASVVLAAAFLALAALLVGGLVVRSAQDERASEDGFRAVLLAQEKAEELESLSFADLAPEPEEEVPGWPGFRRSVSVEDLGGGTKRVTVRVTYPTRGGGRGAQALVFERAVDL